MVTRSRECALSQGLGGGPSSTCVVESIKMNAVEEAKGKKKDTRLGSDGRPAALESAPPFLVNSSIALL